MPEAPVSDPQGKLWFFDCVTVSNFALIGRLDILETRYAHRLALTTQVVDEISRGVVSGYRDLESILIQLDKGFFASIVLTGDERTTYREYSNTLGQGEASTIAAAFHRRATVVTDDRAARQLSKDLGLSLTGTIGILVAAAKDSTLLAEAADEVLEMMIAEGFYSPVKRISDVL